MNLDGEKFEAGTHSGTSHSVFTAVKTNCYSDLPFVKKLNFFENLCRAISHTNSVWFEIMQLIFHQKKRRRKKKNSFT